MKSPKSTIQILFISSGFALFANGCAQEKITEGREISSVGPTILNPRMEPNMIELNRDLQPTKSPEVLADVKDFKGKVTQVKLKFTDVPLEIPMKNIGGTTWKAELSPRQIRSLAVSGDTVRYNATIVAMNSQGQVTESQSRITLSIKAPDLSKNITS